MLSQPGAAAYDTLTARGIVPSMTGRADASDDDARSDLDMGGRTPGHTPDDSGDEDASSTPKVTSLSCPCGAVRIDSAQVHAWGGTRAGHGIRGVR